MKSRVFIFLISSSLFAGTTGKLTGVVTDIQTSEPLIGCNIMIMTEGVGAATDVDGEYAILNLGPGFYEITTSMIGYQKVTYKNVAISIDQTTRLNITLNVVALEGDAIIVTDRRIIRKDVTNTEARITAEELEVMPVTDVHDVIKLQGGVTQDAFGGIHIRGGRSSEVMFMVDGVSMTDVYDGGISVPVENNTIQELQVISGTFNAEYGKAMSGIINMVTKDGTNKFEGSFRSFFGDHYSTNDIYRNLSIFEPVNQLNLEGQLSGPIIPNFLTFFVSGRRYNTDGWLNGMNTFSMYGDTLSTIDYNPMNWTDKWSVQNKLSFKFTPQTKLKLNYMLSHEESQGYDHVRQMTQAGRSIQYNNGKFLGLNLSHAFSSRSFFDLNFSQYNKKLESYLFEDSEDDRYKTPDSLYFMQITGQPWDTLGINFYPQYSYLRWGVDTGRFLRHTVSSQAKFDYTNQINAYNQIKFGFDYQIHQLELDSYSLMDSSQNDQVFTPVIPQLGDGYDLSGNDIFQLENGRLELSDLIPSWVSHFHVSRSYYNIQPEEFSAYLQDKVEYGDMIINMGVRYDRFDPHSWIPLNPHEPYIQNPRDPHLDSLSLEQRLDINWGDTSHFTIDIITLDTLWFTYADFGGYADMGNGQWDTGEDFTDTNENGTWDEGESYIDMSELRYSSGWYQETLIKSQWSPRFGIAYPISDKGVIHFSYGIFFQMPQFELLYKDPGYKMSEGSGQFGVFGNPDLEPQKTISYELGLQQELTSDLKLEFTGYFRDVRDWVTTGIPIDLGAGASYFTYVNKDYSNVRGILLSFDKRYSQFHSWHLDYTFQVAEGSNSNPEEEFGAHLSNSEPSRSIIPLDWDQRHNLNGSVYVGNRDWGSNLIMQVGSGYPYTPYFNNASNTGQNVANIMVKNSRTKLPTINFDLKLFRNIQVGKIKGRFLLNIYNLFDRRNENNVWGDTGRSGSTSEIERALVYEEEFPEVLRPNTVSDYLNHPEWYSPPRQIQMGLELSW